MLLLSLLGLMSGAKVAYQHIFAIKACPVFLYVPLCYLVTVGYLLVFLAAVFRINKIFLLGWLPIFTLAFVGSLGELLGNDLCPKSSAEIPMCYFSLLLATVIMVLFIITKKKVQHA